MKLVQLKDQENHELFERSKLDDEDALLTVKGIIENVKENGDLALKQYTEKFDKAQVEI